MKESTNKKKQMTVIRNVLATPYEKFWPLLNTTDSDVLAELLSKVLPSAAISRGSLSKKKLNKIYREKDATKRKLLWKQKENSNQSKEQLEKAKMCRKFLLMGVNSVTRGLERSDVAACLISGDVTPRMLVQHVILAAARRGVTVLVVPLLKKITHVALDFPCMTLALHKCVTEDKTNTFYELYELITKLGKSFSVPDHLSSLETAEEADRKQEDSTDEDTSPLHAPAKKDDTISSCGNTFQYLVRPSVYQRAFIPPKPEIQIDTDGLIFIPVADDQCNNFKPLRKFTHSEKFGDESDQSNNSDTDTSHDSEPSKRMDFISVKGVQKTNKVLRNKIKNRVTFKSTIVKRIKSNPNKKRRKVS